MHTQTKPRGTQAELIAEAHAKRYPLGCRGSWSTMCEECCARLGGDPPGPVFRIGKLAVPPTHPQANEVALYLGSMLYCSRPTLKEAYAVALEVYYSRNK